MTFRNDYSDSQIEGEGTEKCVKSHIVDFNLVTGFGDLLCSCLTHQQWSYTSFIIACIAGNDECIILKVVTQFKDSGFWSRYKVTGKGTP